MRPGAARPGRPARRARARCGARSERDLYGTQDGAPNTYKASTSGIFASPKRIKGSGLGITYSTADKKRHSEAKKTINLRRFIVSGFCIHQPDFTVIRYKLSLFASFFNRQYKRVLCIIFDFVVFLKRRKFVFKCCF